MSSVPAPKPATATTPVKRSTTNDHIAARARVHARHLVEDEVYREALKIRLRRGEAGAMETLLWQYAYGKPKDDTPAAAVTNIVVVKPW